MKRVLWLAAVVFSTAHVGSPDTFFEGAAGPYPVRVIIRTPGIVPGLADITVRVTGGAALPQTITVLPLRGGLPTAALPPPDTASRIPGDSTLFSAQLWLMSPGAYSVQVTATGPAGSGTVLVPVMSVATRRLGMNRPVAIALLAMGMFLFIGALTIVGAAVREGVLPPGVEVDPARRRRARWIMAVAGIILALGIYGGKAWWDGEDSIFVRGMYRPMPADAALRADGGRAVLRLSLVDSVRSTRQWSPLIPDHGKLVHLFVIDTAGNGFAHLHPRLVDSSTFDAALPPLPAGRYRVYADVVHESGFAQTLRDSLTIPGGGTVWHPSDADDSWDAGLGTGDSGLGIRLEDGSRMTWARDSVLSAHGETALRFTITGADGRPAMLEPYMGMASHAVIARDDGAVFIHLHPMGTIAVASQQVFRLRETGDTVRGRLGARITAAGNPMSDTTLPGAFAFPYAFPQPGRYRIWVQVKRGGRVLTGQFEATVT